MPNISRKKPNLFKVIKSKLEKNTSVLNAVVLKVGPGLQLKFFRQNVFKDPILINIMVIFYLVQLILCLSQAND